MTVCYMQLLHAADSGVEREAHSLRRRRRDSVGQEFPSGMVFFVVVQE